MAAAYAQVGHAPTSHPVTMFEPATDLYGCLLPLQLPLSGLIATGYVIGFLCFSVDNSFNFSPSARLVGCRILVSRLRRHRVPVAGVRVGPC